MDRYLILHDERLVGCHGCGELQVGEVSLCANVGFEKPADD
jgi:hypothetical protein